MVGLAMEIYVYRFTVDLLEPLWYDGIVTTLYILFFFVLLSLFSSSILKPNFYL